ncbi:MAG TPA: diacylglycerol kinase [Armatimonadota bacterium]|nr:diacylglycerol kinase [Armatimonadota bacterium]
MKNTNLFQSFSHAFEGLSHVLWTQKHVRTQLLIVIMVMLLSYAMRLEMIKVLFILSAVALVLIAELFNTAVEVVVNMITQEYHPLAKIAKDVAAAGVLIASLYALLVGGAIFLNGARVRDLFHGSAHHALSHIPAPNPIIVLLLCFGVLSLIVMLGKSRKQHGSILQGGAVSGHSAVAFMLFAAIAIYGHNVYVTFFAFLLAVLVAQSRVEGKIHTLTEVIWGATVAIILMALIVLFTPGG